MAIAAETFESNKGLLWGLCYRMTGNAADADDLLQETFIRALERPPRRLDEPLRPWLVRVCRPYPPRGASVREPAIGRTGGEAWCEPVNGGGAGMERGRRCQPRAQERA